MRINLKNCDWVIMGANNWISGKPTIEKIIKENNYNGTIMIVKRVFDCNDKEVLIFVLGAPGDYGKIGKKVSFVQDTGRGYGKTGHCIIENIIKISDSEIIDEGNGIGVNEKRPLWVFK
jgi:hypothetical protein